MHSTAYFINSSVSDRTHGMRVRDWYCLGFVHQSANTYGTSYGKTHTSRFQDRYHPGLVHCTCTAHMIHHMANTHREFWVGTSHSTHDTSHGTHTARVQDQYSSGLVCRTSHTIHHKAHTQSSGSPVRHDSGLIHRTA